MPIKHHHHQTPQEKEAKESVCGGLGDEEAALGVCPLLVGKVRVGVGDLCEGLVFCAHVSCPGVVGEGGGGRKEVDGQGEEGEGRSSSLLLLTTS